MNTTTTFNVLSDKDSFMEGNVAYFTTAEMKNGSEVFDAMNSGYAPKETDEGVINFQQVEVSLPFVERVYELAFGDDAINRDFSEQDVLDMLKQMSDVFAVAQE